MSSRTTEDCLKTAKETCQQVQLMIDFTSTRLKGLRRGSMSDKIIQNEIRESESKIVHLVSKQLAAKDKLTRDQVDEELDRFPRLVEWLRIIGLDDQVISSLCKKLHNFNALITKSESEVKLLVSIAGGLEEEREKVWRAIQNTLYCKALLAKGEVYNGHQLHWSNFQALSFLPSPASGSNSPRIMPVHGRSSSSSFPAGPTSTPEAVIGTALAENPPKSPLVDRQKYPGQTPPQTPSHHRGGSSSASQGSAPFSPTIGKSRFPTTPPPQKKNKLQAPQSEGGAKEGLPQHGKLTKSRSHESHLSNRINNDVDIAIVKRYLKNKPDNLTLAASCEVISQRKNNDNVLEPASPRVTSPKRSPPYSHSDENSIGTETSDYFSSDKQSHLSVPISPVAPLGMKHQIQHRFQNSLIMGSCEMCKKHVIFGKSCRHCKAKFHNECARRAKPTCGLSEGLIEWVKENMKDSPSLYHKRGNPVPGINKAASYSAFAPDSSSPSSCTSSTPSSPANFLSHAGGSCSTPSPLPSPAVYISTECHMQFLFPDFEPDTAGSRVSTMDQGLMFSADPTASVDVINTNTSNDSDRSDKTLIDTTSSSENKSVSALEHVDSVDEDRSWTRGNSISVAIREWNIPYENIDFEREIGRGRYGVVWKANWHGPVAVKQLNVDDKDDTARLAAFKVEISNLRKTRHDNLVLFMGACMKPPNLCIITSFCTGKTLYYHLHEDSVSLNKDKFPMNRVIQVAYQVAQGMSYLHAKRIIHKDLKSKNVFLERDRAVLTDFGLFSVAKLCMSQNRNRPEWLHLPAGWLCYLAPEILRELSPNSKKDLPFDENTDVYAFGTLWYELLSSEFPYTHLSPEMLIWQIGHGVQQPLGNLQVSKDAKELLLILWSFTPTRRPRFDKILSLVEKLPKKRLIRSPSLPASKSVECVF